MEEFVQVLQIFSTIGGLIALVGGPWVFIVGRKYFAEAKHTVTPVQLSEKMETQRHALINELNGIAGRAELAADKRQMQLLENLADVREGMKEAIRRAGQAMETAGEAKHKTELIEERVSGIKQVLDTRLAHFETLLREGREK